MPETIHEHRLASRESASLAAANLIVGLLQERLQRHESAAFVATGGSSPQQCYAAMAKAALPWNRVQVMLSDERWVPGSDPSSNERMLRETLLTGNAQNAVVHPWFAENVSAEQRALELDTEIPGLPLPFAATLLGMGEDGHIASLFADAENFAAAADSDSDRFCVPVRTAASEHQRLSLTLRALLASDAIVLLFYGDAKLDTFARARAGATELPVSRLLSQNEVPVHLFWSP